MRLAFRIYLMLFLSIVFHITKSVAQQVGFPIKNYTTKEYKGFSQTWFCQQDDDNILYFGSNSEVITYDGKNWEKIFIRKSSPVRALLWDDKSGRMFVGAAGEFGYLKKDSNGRMKYHSLSGALPEKDKVFDDIWKVFKTSAGVVFQASEKLFIWDGKVVRVVTPETSFALSFNVNDQIVVRERETGLKKVDAGKASLIPGGDYFANVPVLGIIPSPIVKDELWVLTGDRGILAMSGDHKTFPTGVFIKEVSFKSQDFLLNAGVLGIGNISDSLIYINSRNGVGIFDAEGNLLDHINQENGLNDNAVPHVFCDKQNQLWLSLNNGIAKVDYHSPLLLYKNSREGTYESIIRHEGILYGATVSGLFIIQKPGEHSSSVNPRLISQTIEFWRLLSHNGDLFASSSGGLFLVEGEKIKMLTPEHTNFAAPSKKYQNRIFAGEEDGFTILEKRNDTWSVVKRISMVGDDILSVHSVKPQKDEEEIFLTMRYKGVHRVLLKDDLSYKIKSYDTANGLVEGGNTPLIFQDTIRYNTDKGLLTYYEKYDTGPKAKCFRLSLSASKAISDTTKNELEIGYPFQGKFWIDGYADNQMVMLREKRNGKFEKVRVVLNDLSTSEVNQYSADQDGSFWIAGVGFVGKFIPEKSTIYDKKYNLLLREIIAGRKDTLSVIRSSPEIEYAKNNLTFHFAAPFFIHEDLTTYSYQLSGYDTAWSTWSSEGTKQFTNLHEGEYTFRVKAKNIFGRESDNAQFSFTILPPWYRTSWAYFLYVLLLILIIWMCVELSVRRLKKSKVRLEKIVSQRTAEVQAQKEMLESKNKDITDSINYAQRIQHAILPYAGDIKAVLPESFILFKPRDIVSGDFYWFGKKNGLSYIAAVDCTGHGVPGAFMSMIGNTLLNEILNDEGMDGPGKILSELHNRVRIALRQQDADSTSRDGMDIALCVIDPKNQALQYAGANRPLYLITPESSFQEIKPNKVSIGGFDDQTQRTFHHHEIKISKNSMVYIFTDGFADQFGGPGGKKFMAKNLQKVLLEIHRKSADAQRAFLEAKFETWKGNQEQVDDVLVIGFRIL